MAERIYSKSREKTSPTPRGAGRRRSFPVRTAIAVALVLGFGAMALVVAGCGSSSPAAPEAPPVPITVSGLNTLAAAVPSAIYWIGPQTGYTLELTKTSANQIYIRYLPAGVAVGSRNPYLTIGTYPLANAFAVTRTAAGASGTVNVPIGDGGIAFYSSTDPEHVYFAYPGAGSQVEVYDPSPGHAAALVSSRQVKPVLAKATASAPKAVTPTALKALSASLGQPVYWAGAAPGMRYELSVTSAGNIFLRYLPKGVPVGSSKLYEMVATYPVPSAFAVTRALAAKPGAVRIAVGGGATAFYSSSRPTNVYLAYPGSNYQVEVYDPSASRAHQLVASHAIAPVP